MRDHYKRHSSKDLENFTFSLFKGTHGTIFFRGAISVNMSRGIFIRSLNSLCQTITEMTSIRITNNPNGVLRWWTGTFPCKNKHLYPPTSTTHLPQQRYLRPHVLQTSRWINITNYPKQTLNKGLHLELWLRNQTCMTSTT